MSLYPSKANWRSLFGFLSSGPLDTPPKRWLLGESELKRRVSRVGSVGTLARDTRFEKVATRGNGDLTPTAQSKQRQPLLYPSLRPCGPTRGYRPLFSGFPNRPQKPYPSIPAYGSTRGGRNFLTNSDSPSRPEGP